MREKPETNKVTVFACGNCKRHFNTKSEADAHCICKCGRVVDKERRLGYSVNDECELCRSRGFLLNSTRRVSDLEKQLAEAKKHNEQQRLEHEKLKADDKPPKDEPRPRGVA